MRKRALKETFFHKNVTSGGLLRFYRDSTTTTRIEKFFHRSVLIAHEKKAETTLR